jgi:hypothetical protein
MKGFSETLEAMQMLPTFLQNMCQLFDMENLWGKLYKAERIAAKLVKYFLRLLLSIEKCRTV